MTYPYSFSESGVLVTVAVYDFFIRRSHEVRIFQIIYNGG